MQEKVRPFVKWAGGKGGLISQLKNFYPFDLENGVIEKYVEPFIGGGAVLIDILQKYGIKKCYYGHLHGSSHSEAIEGIYEGIYFKLISSDYLNFKLVKVK